MKKSLNPSLVVVPYLPHFQCVCVFVWETNGKIH